MKSNYKRLGDLITPVSVKNTEMVTDDLRGVNYQKYFMPSVANTVGVDLSGYKVINKGQFACNLMHVGRDECLPIALNRQEKPIIVSPAYFAFEVKNENEILSEFLFLWFKRSEFDREACFYTDADVRQGLIKSSFMDIQIPVPPIEEQRKIVEEYQAVERRIENNRRLIATLEATAQTIYRKMFVNNIDPNNLPQGWHMGTISEFGTVITGKTPSSNCPEDFGNNVDFITPCEFKHDDIFYSRPIRKLSITGANKLKNKLIPKYGLSVTCIGSDMGKVRICKNKCISNQQINSIITNSKIDIPYLFYSIRKMKNELQRLAIGSSTMPILSKSEFENINIIFPSVKALEKFYNLTNPILSYCFSIEKEIEVLLSTSSILLNKLSK